MSTIHGREPQPTDRFVEEGNAFAELSDFPNEKERGLAAVRRDMKGRQRFDVIVIGGGQAGLSVGYHLRRQGLRFVILETNERVGDSWRRRWDSLRLFTPARFNGLDGMVFPAAPDSLPTKDEMADYLEHYARHFRRSLRRSRR